MGVAVDAGARCRMVGLVVGTGLAFALTRTYLFDYAPVVLALALTIAVLIGVAVTPRPVRARGAASLRPRRIREYVPTHALIAILVLAVGTGIFAYYPTPQRPSHEYEYFHVWVSASLYSTLATLATAAVLSALTVWAIVRSPQAGIEAADRATDDAWRRATVHAIVNSCAALFAVVFAAIAFWYADQQTDWRAGGSPTWGFALSIVGGLGLALFARYAGAMVTPVRAEVPRQPDADEVSVAARVQE